MKPLQKILYWAPRVICIAAIFFISMLAADSFSPGNTFWQNILALLIHLVPSFTLLVILILAWKWELAGGIFLTVVGVAWSIFIYMINYQRTSSPGKSFLAVLMVGIPLVISGVLFIISHFSNRQKQ